MRLKELLSDYQIDKLQDLAYQWNIQKISKLSKSELVIKITENMLNPEKFQRMMLYLDLKELELLKERPCFREVKSHDGFWGLWHHGIIIGKLEKNKFDVADDVFELFCKIYTPEFIKQQQRINLIRKYVSACINLYGVISIGKVTEIYRNQTGKNLMDNELQNLAIDPYYPLRHIGLCEDYLVCESLIVFCEDSSEVEQLLQMQENKPFYIPDQEVLLNYSDDNFAEKNDQYEILKEYIMNKYISNEKIVEDFCKDIQLSFKMDFGFEDIASSINANIDQYGINLKSEKETKKFLAYAMNLLYNTRRWIHRGYTDKEVEQMNGSQDLNNQKKLLYDFKVGRNDPCPCSSGKKFKKCCGR